MLLDHRFLMIFSDDDRNVSYPSLALNLISVNVPIETNLITCEIDFISGL